MLFITNTSKGPPKLIATWSSSQARNAKIMPTSNSSPFSNQPSLLPFNAVLAASAPVSAGALTGMSGNGNEDVSVIKPALPVEGLVIDRMVGGPLREASHDSLAVVTISLPFYYCYGCGPLCVRELTSRFSFHFSRGRALFYVWDSLIPATASTKNTSGDILLDSYSHELA
jgi:hypothetical protein